MRRLLVTALFALAALGIGASATAQDVFRTPNWHSDFAAAALQNTGWEAEARALTRLALNASADTVIQRVERLRQRTDWPAPAREAAIYEFAQSLRQHPSPQRMQPVLAHLQSYTSEVLVPMSDNRQVGVPLFNIATAAHGIGNQWRYREAQRQAETLLNAEQYDSIIERYQQGSALVRRAITATVANADANRSRDLLPASLAALQRDSGFSGLAAGLALAQRDADAVLTIVQSGRSADVAMLIRALDEYFQPAPAAELLSRITDTAKPEYAALAIGQLAPLARDDGKAQDLLLAKLSDPQLGSAAAMALARLPDSKVRASLQQLAEDGGPVAARARLALRLADQQTPEGRQ